jgi:glyoxylase-like metal-dependent hydrolase (beta-lactamase superfamily II)
MLIESFAVGPLACNCSLIADLSSRRALVIDPGGDVQKIRSRLARHDLRLQAILLTHAHIDHVAAARELQAGTDLPVRIHPDDRFLLQMLGVQAAMIGLPTPGSPEASFDLVDGATVAIGPAKLTVMHTPGHSPGGVSLLLDGDVERVLFSGDTLFQGSIGRSDLWGGDGALLLRSIRNRLYPLDASVRVITGHGPETTIGEERDSNPFVRATP